MQQKHSCRWSVIPSAIVALVAMGWIGATDVQAKRRPSVKGSLQATTADPDAEGNFEENVEDGLPDGSGDIQGDLTVRARKLAPATSFGVNVGGVRIGALHTSAAGKGRARFSSRPRGRIQPLSVDPRGKQITLTDEAGDEMLEGEISDPTTPGGIQCCLNTHDASGDQQGCDSLLPADCTAAGGVDMGPGTCEPDPCPATGPDGGTDGPDDTSGGQ
ncbi:MAG TPA: hypothetical protein VEM57_03035 [Candidatus Binatus sp.]|nr:hypothetical protein [Candidatus Binatus sp.]